LRRRRIRSLRDDCSLTPHLDGVQSVELDAVADTNDVV
jgi:hypothetical protein